MGAGTQKITDPVEIRGLLTQATAEGVRAQLALDSGDSSSQARVLDRDFEKSGIVLSLPGQLRGKGGVGDQFLVVLFIRGARALAFSARAVVPPIHADVADEVYLALPKQIFLLQRRSEVRLEVSPAYDLNVELSSHGERGKRIRRRLLDVSSRGFSFVVTSNSELGRYPVGTFLRKITLRVHGRELSFDAQVCNRTPISPSQKEPRPKYKIGCKFLRISDEDQEFILALGVTRLASFVLK